MSKNFQGSLADGQHHMLNQLVGSWEGSVKTWFEPGQLADESPISGTIRSVLDGRFILHEYNGSLQGKPLSGIAIYGYQMSLKKFQSAWIDSFHTGTSIMFSESNRAAESFDVTGGYVYVTPEAEHHWGWRTELELKSADELLITSYNVSPEGEEAKATEILYTRKR